MCFLARVAPMTVALALLGRPKTPWTAALPYVRVPTKGARQLPRKATARTYSYHSSSETVTILRSPSQPTKVTSGYHQISTQPASLALALPASTSTANGSVATVARLSPRQRVRKTNATGKATLFGSEEGYSISPYVDNASWQPWSKYPQVAGCISNHNGEWTHSCVDCMYTSWWCQQC